MDEVYPPYGMRFILPKGGIMERVYPPHAPKIKTEKPI